MSSLYLFLGHFSEKVNIRTDFNPFQSNTFITCPHKSCVSPAAAQEHFQKQFALCTAPADRQNNWTPRGFAASRDHDTHVTPALCPLKATSLLFSRYPNKSTEQSHKHIKCHCHILCKFSIPIKSIMFTPVSSFNTTA
jgi:hypothetical protein